MPTATIRDILGPGGAIARRLGDNYEHRPQQLEMAAAVERAFREQHHLLVEAGTGVGKSFAYLLPAIEFAVKHKKRIVISTHTISLQEQLIDKDIPLIRSVYPDEFTAVLVKGRSNYLCQRRLGQARSRQDYLFEQDRQLESLWTIEQWCQDSLRNRGLGSLAELPVLPDPAVWDRVCAEHGNCLGKRCQHYEHCFWQAAKRRMLGANILIVNHALFFSDLGLRMAGVNYLPKYDLVILDEAHTVEDVAGQHFGLKISESSIRYNLRSLYDVKRGKGMLSTHGSVANDAIRDVVDLNGGVERFFDRLIDWQETAGRSNGRVHQKDAVENDLSPQLRNLAKHLKAMSATFVDGQEEESSELNAMADKVGGMAETLDAILAQKLEDAVYWFDIAPRTPRRVSLHAAPVNVAEGLRRQLFDKLPSVVMTSATLCAAKSRPAKKPIRKDDTSGTGYQPVSEAPTDTAIRIRQGAHLPHWTKASSIYSVCFRLADSLPASVLSEWRAARDAIIVAASQQNRSLSPAEVAELDRLHSEKIEAYLDSGIGECWLRRGDVARLMQDELRHFDGKRYRLLAWSVMPNHVHVVIQPMVGFDLPVILHSWKSYTATQANKILNRRGTFWQVEYYDHLIRDADELRHAVEYAWENPDRAGLEDWRWRGMNEDLVNGILNGTIGQESGEHGLVARATDDGDSRVTHDRDAPVAGQALDPAFAYIASRLGVGDVQTLQLGSPFDYSKQATLYIESTLPEPSDANRFLPAAGERIVHYLKQTSGGAFVLFTSYKMLIDAANRLKPALDELGLPLLVQGQGAPRKVLLDRFRALDNAVLFGTSSFWQGIDVQGQKLRNVIIVKLPFDVPDEPVIEARLEAITRSGGNAFMQYSVPQAVIKLKQGFGRLIRSRTDTGIVVILDSRVKGKRYGRIFLEALPECRIVEVTAAGNSVFASEDEDHRDQSADNW